MGAPHEAASKARPPSRLRAIGGAIAAITGTRAFQQAALSVAVVTLAGALVMWLLLERTSEIVSRQVIETMTVEAEGLAGIAQVAGPAAAIEAVAQRSRAAGPRLYLLESATGTKLAGNLDRWPGDLPRGAPGVAKGPVAGGTFEYRAEGTAAVRLAAGVSIGLASEMGLLVGRDLEPQRQLAADVRWLYLAGFGALALAGLVAGILSSLLALGRIGEITATSDQIMTGDFAKRVRITGSGDELDRLAANLNAMLDRIESLMAGLREVSDNIAHDLKTPLTRLRTRAEAALRDREEVSARDGLARVIEDADELIKTFNALLLIARLEAGALEQTAETFDVVALVRDVAELYEPVAEEAGMTLSCRIGSTTGIAEACGEATVAANRQLVGQAIANMIDNAIKYGRTEETENKTGDAAGNDKSSPGRGPDIEVTLALDEAEARIEVADRGPGIPPGDRERVLKRFVRLEASRTRPGTGLGLSLVAAVAHLHHGRILLEDNVPGLRIVLALPRRR